jgi:hypothetical protein
VVRVNDIRNTLRVREGNHYFTIRPDDVLEIVQ